MSGLALNQRVRSGLVPPLAEGFIARPPAAGLEAALVAGAAVALVTADEAATRGDRLASGGKTQLACYTALRLWRSRAVDLLVWVTATSREAVLSGYLQAAARLGLDDNADAEAVAARLLAWLTGTTRTWLVVLDDLKSAEDLDGLWPAGRAGRLLITTSDPAAVPAGRGVHPLAVPLFSAREALAYLSDRLTADTDQRQGAVALAGELGGEPAVLAEAAAVIASTGTDCGAYLQNYYLPQRAQLAAAGGAPHPAAVTWRAAAAHAGQLHPGGSTWLVLLLAALLDGHAIPGTVFTTPATCQYVRDEGTVGQLGPRNSWTAVLALEHAGLLAIDHTSTPPVVFIRPALQTAVRLAAPPGLLDRAGQAAADALVHAWPAGQPRSWAAAAMRACACAVQQFAGDALWAAGCCHQLLIMAGQSLDAAGLTGPAAAWWRELAANSERLLGPAHPDTAALSGVLADALLAAGQAAEAVWWAERVLDGYAGVLAPGHPAVIAAQVRLGRALAAAGKPGDAAAILAEAAGRSERYKGNDDTGTVAIREEYAAACLAAGNAGEAVRCCRRCLADREGLHGPAHPAALAARSRLAGAYIAAGKAEDAIAQRKLVLSGTEQALGRDHPDTLAARARLAASCGAAGKMGAALQAHEHARAEYQRVLGADHPDTLACCADLAQAYAAAGQLGEALPLLRETISRCEQALSSGDPLTLALRQVLADISGEMTAR